MNNPNVSKFIDLIYSWWDVFRIEVLNIFSFFYVKVYFAIFLFVNGLNWFYASYIYSNILPETRDLIALHYNVEFGVNLIGAAKNIYILPTLGLLIAILNFSLLLTVHKSRNSKFLGNFFLLPVIIVNIYLFIGLVSIYLSNFK